MAKLADTGLEVPELESLPRLGLTGDFARESKADAVNVPVGYMGVTAEHLIERMIQIRFGRVVNPDQRGMLHVRIPVRGKYFVTGSPTDTINNPKTNWTRAGLPRYEWFPSPDEAGVEFGFLIEK
jgi:hypothetical protein